MKDSVMLFNDNLKADVNGARIEHRNSEAERGAYRTLENLLPCLKDFK